MEPMLSVKNLVKRFGGLRQVRLEVVGSAANSTRKAADPLGTSHFLRVGQAADVFLRSPQIVAELVAGFVAYGRWLDVLAFLQSCYLLPPWSGVAGILARGRN